MKFCLYSLVRRTESVPFYIGVTTRWEERLTRHRLDFGRDIIGSVITRFDTDIEADFAETVAIQYWLSQGAKLENRCYKTKRVWNPLYREARRQAIQAELARRKNVAA
jgi:hypothetical protein